MRRISETKSAYVKMLAVAVAVAMGVMAVALVVPATMATPSNHTPSAPATMPSWIHVAKAKPPAVKSLTFANSYVSDLVASSGSTVLIVNLLLNGSYQLVLWDAATGAVLPGGQTWVPLGANAYPLSVVAAGDAFFFNFYNLNNPLETIWEEISLSGTVTNVTTAIPTAYLGDTFLWTFIYGTSTAAYLSDEQGGYLVELTAPSLAYKANLSAALPAGLFLSAILPEGKLVYAAGEVIESTCNAYNCGTYGYFGVISSKTVKKVTTYSIKQLGTTSTEPANLSGEFASLAYIKPYVYLSGALSIENLNTSEYMLELVAPYFYSYDVTTTTLTNLSSAYSTAAGKIYGTWGIPAIEPFGKDIVLSASWYLVYAPTSPTCSFFGEPGCFNGAFYEWVPSTSTMTNFTSYFPAGYISGAYYVTAESSGYFISGGSDSTLGIGEIVSLKT